MSPLPRFPLIRAFPLIVALAMVPATMTAQDATMPIQEADDDDGFDDWGLLGLLGLAGLLGGKRDNDRVADTSRV